MGKKVALVIGHSKNKPGAKNVKYNRTEFNFNEGMVIDIKNIIERDYEVEIVYRDTYSGLPDKINALNPDLVISFHCNAFDTKASGTETLYYHTSKKGKEVAKVFQSKMVDILGLPDRGIKGRTSKDRGGHLLKRTNAPCIIVEPFFIDNNFDYMRAGTNYYYLIRKFRDAIYNTMGIV